MMVTQIMPHHTAYLHSTPNVTASSVAPQRHKPTEDARRFHFVVSRVPLVAHVTSWYGPIGWHSLSWAERKEEG